VTHHRRVEDGDRFSRATIMLLDTFATAVLGLHYAIEAGSDPRRDASWADSAYSWTVNVVRTARLLEARV